MWAKVVSPLRTSKTRSINQVLEPVIKAGMISVVVESTRVQLTASMMCLTLQTKTGWVKPGPTMNYRFKGFVMDRGGGGTGVAVSLLESLYALRK